ncbi:hypothetical protein, partial [Pseudomonas syringae group genomosp. 7]|uniref:hypothetical protein n=1 Tax=Pseudomonas syringae group genomosp. 7 TaxID=251699 RepID=UPI00376FE221
MVVVLVLVGWVFWVVLWGWVFLSLWWCWCGFWFCGGWCLCGWVCLWCWLCWCLWWLCVLVGWVGGGGGGVLLWGVGFVGCLVGVCSWVVLVVAFFLVFFLGVVGLGLGEVVVVMVRDAE